MADTENNDPKSANEAENSVVVEVEGDAAPERADPVDSNPEDKIKILQDRLEAERRARAEAEARAREAALHANHAYSRAEDSDMHVVNTAISTVRGENDALTDKYAEAIEAGDYQAAAKIQRAISQNEAKLLQLENGKAAMEARPRQQAVVDPGPSDPVERFASQLSPRSADWVRANPQCVTDPRLNQKMIAAHNMAVADGYAPDTDDYFAYVEDMLKINRRSPRAEQEDGGSPMSAASKPMARQAPPPAAPASRETSGRNTVRLSAMEADIARSLGMKPEEYAKNKLLLRKEGRLN